MKHFFPLCGWMVVFLLGGMPVQAQTQYPLTIENCGYSHTYESAPTAVVSIGQDVTETLYLLGLGDKVIGTSVWFNEVTPSFEKLNNKIERLSDNAPSLDAVLAKKPDFVASQYEWYIGKNGIVASRETLLSHNIASYVLPVDCDNKDNTVGVDGTRLQLFSTKSIYKGIRELSEIFDVQEQGKRLVQRLKDREQRAIESAKTLNKMNLSAVFWYSSAKLNRPPYVAGEKGAAGYMMYLLGIKNVIHSNEEWPTVDWTTIAKADPSIIVVAKMKRRRFEADDFKQKIQFLKTNPVTRNMTAVKNNRFVIMDVSAMNATTRFFEGLEQLIKSVRELP